MARLGTLVIVAIVGAVVFLLANKRATVEEPVPAASAVDSSQLTIGQQAPAVVAIQPPANPYWQAVVRQYQSYLQQSLKRGVAPGVGIAIVRDSSVLFLAGLGYRDFATRDTLDVHSLFRLGSVSKSFAGVLTAILVQEKVLAWDDKVVKYVPGFRLKSRAHTDSLTIAHLLSHTTGLPYHAYTDRVDDGAHFDTLLYHLRDLDLIGPPGKFYSYQNVGFSLISKVIEAATSKSYEQVMQEKVFTPLNMQTSSMTFDAMASTTNKARPHSRQRKSWRPMAVSTTYYNVGPAGGVNASINDMALWLRALTHPHDTLLSAETRAELFRPAVKAIARNRNFRKWKKSKGSYYALGWRVLTFKDDTVNYHGGYANGYRSEVAIKRDDRIGICVLVNAPGPLADQAIPEFFRIYEAYRPQILKWEKENINPLIARTK